MLQGGGQSHGIDIKFPLSEHVGRKKGLGWPPGQDQSLCAGSQNVLSPVIHVLHGAVRAFSDGLLYLFNSPACGNYYYPTSWARKLRLQGIVTKLVSGMQTRPERQADARGRGRGEAEKSAVEEMVSYEGQWPLTQRVQQEKEKEKLSPWFSQLEN